jgi:hypothetical protein
MKKIIIAVLLMISVAACDRYEIPLRGTVTIENTLYWSGSEYHALGFNFTTASLRRTNSPPLPDITLLAETDAGGIITAVSFNGNSGFQYLPFSLVGEYTDEPAAIAAFQALTTVDNTGRVWLEVGKPIAVNQIWLFQTEDEKYAKIRIVEVITEMRDNVAFASCKFQWVFQPSGSLTFPY